MQPSSVARHAAPLPQPTPSRMHACKHMYIYIYVYVHEVYTYLYAHIYNICISRMECVQPSSVARHAPPLPQPTPSRMRARHIAVECLKSHIATRFTMHIHDVWAFSALSFCSPRGTVISHKSTLCKMTRYWIHYAYWRLLKTFAIENFQRFPVARPGAP